MNPRLILASSSPRRRQLLEGAGYAFEVEPSRIEEPEPAAGEPPGVYAAQLAWLKAADVAARRGSGLVLGADTVCAVGGEILNKPRDRADAERMIRLQEGHDTDVISGLCLYRADCHEWVGAIEVSAVQFRRLSQRERDDYLDSGRWQGKSGAYGVQDRDPFVSVVRGSFSNVVGLPMERLGELLEKYEALAADATRSVARIP
jgi:septum formation protein